MDKSHEQAKITRERNKSLRDAAKAAREAETKQDTALVLGALRAVLKDPEATTAQRLFAVAVLDNMKYYHFAPYGVRHLLQTADAAKIDAEIAERLEQIKNK